jgi:glyoxylase-like metal-dependent hydrolase (beta-lactamase superfamily II)
MALAVFPEPVSTQASQTGASRMWEPEISGPAPGEVQVLPVQGNVYLLSGAGANITVQAGADGVLVVDTGLANMSDKVVAAIRTISTRPLRYIVNTSEHEDHTGGNPAVGDYGETIPFREPDYTAGPMGGLSSERASIVAHLTVLQRMSAPIGKAAARPEAAWPDNTYSIDEKRLYFNDEPVVIMHEPSLTDGNSIVFFRKSDVVSVGDILDLTKYPMIDLAIGGSMQALVDALNDVIAVTVPRANAADGTLVVPGHGRISDHAEVVFHRDMVVIIRDRIQDMIKKGMTLEQVKAARPTRDWDRRYGTDSGTWTTDMFVEAAYRSLSQSAGTR